MRDSFKLEDNYNTIKRKKAKKHKENNLFFIFIFIAVCLIIFLFVYLLFNFSSIGYISKSNSNKNYVYTVKKVKNVYQDDTYDEVPRINLNGKNIENINKRILLNYEQVSQKIEYNYEYQFSVSKNILSLLVSYGYYLDENDNEPTRNFETINIDLRTGSILSSDDILNKFHLTRKSVNDYLGVKFYDIYNGLIDYKYFTKKQCDYSCFLKNRQISDNYLNGLSLYVEDGSLIGYKFFYTYSIYNEQDYFKIDDYKFIIKR